MMHFGVISVLPEMFICMQKGVCGRAIEQDLARVDVWNPRDWSSRPHRQVDDKPYGGGPGMVMMYEPMHAAIQHARAQMSMPCQVIYLSPQGRQIKQCDINQQAANKRPLIFIAGRYEGIDERLLTHDVDEEWSIGDFVMSGGELAAMVYIDAIIRLLPGALGNPGSATHDSFMSGLLDYPHYTRPESISGMTVPEVLLSGNHQQIQRFRRKQSLGRTWEKRPDIMDALNLNATDKQLLVEYIDENGRD
jgi:tRNA (guanine37-N1)-methyltransferase